MWHPALEACGGHALRAPVGGTAREAAEGKPVSGIAVS